MRASAPKVPRRSTRKPKGSKLKSNKAPNDQILKQIAFLREVKRREGGVLPAGEEARLRNLTSPIIREEMLEQITSIRLKEEQLLRQRLGQLEHFKKTGDLGESHGIEEKGIIERLKQISEKVKIPERENKRPTGIETRIKKIGLLKHQANQLRRVMRSTSNSSHALELREQILRIEKKISSLEKGLPKQTKK